MEMTRRTIVVLVVVVRSTVWRGSIADPALSLRGDTLVIRTAGMLTKQAAVECKCTSSASFKSTAAGWRSGEAVVEGELALGVWGVCGAACGPTMASAKAAGAIAPTTA